MKSTNPKPIEFTKRSNERAREQRQTDFLRYLAQGESITDTCILIGISRSCYEKWGNSGTVTTFTYSSTDSKRVISISAKTDLDSTALAARKTPLAGSVPLIAERSTSTPGARTTSPLCEARRSPRSRSGRRYSTPAHGD